MKGVTKKVVVGNRDGIRSASSQNGTIESTTVLATVDENKPKVLHAMSQMPECAICSYRCRKTC